MHLSLDIIQDKIEFYEAPELISLEKKINDQIEVNKAIFLEVHSVSHQLHMDGETNRKWYSAVVHFKAKKRSL